MMKKLLIPVVAIAAAATLAACGSGGGSGATAANAPSMGGQPVAVKQVDGTGRVLVDSNGQALYASDQETAAGKVMCTGACNSFWEPATAGKGAPQANAAGGKLAVVKRPDGSRQLTYNGKLLYSFTEDKPGEVTGNGFHDAFNGQQFTWHVVTIGGGSSQNQGASSGGGVVSY
jgi:predicted lipoprotein with Yx(FWY)xxD motif